MGFKNSQNQCKRKANALSPKHMGRGRHYNIDPDREFSRAREILDSDED